VILGASSLDSRQTGLGTPFEPVASSLKFAYTFAANGAKIRTIPKAKESIKKSRTAERLPTTFEKRKRNPPEKRQG